MRQRRRQYLPSTGRKLVLLVTDTFGMRLYAGDHLHAHVDKIRNAISSLAGEDRADWAVAQLKETPSFVTPGWPNPCKAAPMSMGRKAVQR